MAPKQHEADQAYERLSESLADGKALDPRDLGVVLGDLRDRAPARAPARKRAAVKDEPAESPAE